MNAFPNRYVARLVAEKDSKACTLCFKPTTTVLMSENKMDFFYVCPLHLRDEHFSRPIHPEDYKELETKKSELEKQVGNQRKRVDELKPYVWSILASMGTKKDTAGSTESDKDTGSEESRSKTKSKETYESAKHELRRLESELSEISTCIGDYKFKEYILDKDIYRMRVQNHIQAKVRAKKQQELHKPGFFPSAPLHKIGE